MRNASQKARWLSLLLCILLTILSFSACSEEKKEERSSPAEYQSTEDVAKRLEEQSGKPVVTVMMDLPTEAVYSTGPLRDALVGMPGYETDFMLQVESIPSQGGDREAAITHYRTEIMSGKGPDLFICAHRLYRHSAGPDDTSFFHFPVQVMNRHFFLPLDEYIDNAQYMEWEQLQPVVMDAGRNEEGQQIIPLTYSFFVNIFDKAEYTPAASLPMTWDEMCGSEDPVLRDCAIGNLFDIIGVLADYENDKPAFSEEELLAWAETYNGLFDQRPKDMPESEYFMLERQVLERLEIDLNGEKEYTLVPAYNLTGGVTASITTFAAINRNARHPDQAFQIIDYLLSPKIQQSSTLFQGRMEGLPVYELTGNSETPLDSCWRMSEANYQAVSALQEQINLAKFPSPLDVYIWNIDGDTPKKRKDSVHEQYVLMKMLLAES